VYARVSDTGAVVKVAGTPIETLTKKPIELRDKKVLDLTPEQVSRISILTDLPAGPAPTTKPAKKSQVEIERRKQVAEATTSTTKPAAATQPTTKLVAAATTRATTSPATQPAVAEAPKPPPSTWELKSDPKGDADDETVRALLADLHPLRVTKYFEALPTTRPVGHYVVQVTTEGPGGTPVNKYEVRLTDPGSDQPVIGEYNGLSFELPRTFLSKIEGNFAKKPKAEPAPGKPPGLDDKTFDLPGK
jgi:hypothetical protein